MKKRYAIVRVDNNWCPFYSDNEFRVSGFCDGRFECKNCRYGDTKEQLIRKVAQALERTITDGVYVRFGIPITVEKLATDVVEFLGVE